MTTRKITVDEGGLRVLMWSNVRVPKRGTAIRPDDQGRTILHDDGKALGVVVLECDVVDYTHPGGRVAFDEITYTPGVPA